MSDKSKIIVADDGSAVRLRLQDNLDGTHSPMYVGIEYLHQMIHDGVDFCHSGELTLASAATYDHLFVVPAGVQAHLHLFKLDVSGSPVKHQLYEGATVSANGSLQTPLNRNRASDKVSLISLYHAPTVTDAGTLLDYTLIPGGKQEGGVGVATPFIEWVLAGGRTYLSRITNNSGGSITLGYTVDWYEPVGH